MGRNGWEFHTECKMLVNQRSDAWCIIKWCDFIKWRIQSYLQSTDYDNIELMASKINVCFGSFTTDDAKISMAGNNWRRQHSNAIHFPFHRQISVRLMYDVFWYICFASDYKTHVWKIIVNKYHAVNNRRSTIKFCFATVSCELHHAYQSVESVHKSKLLYIWFNSGKFMFKKFAMLPVHYF